MFGACYLLFLVGSDRHATDAVAQERCIRPIRALVQSIFREASSAASVWVASSFMGL